jgi:hypothetical protein
MRLSLITIGTCEGSQVWPVAGEATDVLGAICRNRADAFQKLAPPPSYYRRHRYWRWYSTPGIVASLFGMARRRLFSTKTTTDAATGTTMTMDASLTISTCRSRRCGRDDSSSSLAAYAVAEVVGAVMSSSMFATVGGSVES